MRYRHALRSIAEATEARAALNTAGSLGFVKMPRLS